jgi:hypothetical protein
MRADRERRLALARQIGPGVAGLVDLRFEIDLGEQAPEELARRAPSLAPAEPLRSL